MSSSCEAAAPKILVVDDVFANRLAVEALLEDHNLSADLAETGLDAVALFRTRAYDLILMDLNMPVMDGIEATRNIRSLEAPGGRRVPIILMTAQSVEEEWASYAAAGVDGSIIKPIDPDAFTALINRYRPKTSDPATAPTDASPTASSVEPDGKAGSPAAAEQESPVLDEEIVLKRMLGKRDFIARAAQTVLFQMPNDLDKLCKQLDAGDAEGARKTVHSIKGGAATIGGVALTGVAASMEKRLQDGNVDYARLRLDELRSEAGRLDREARRVWLAEEG